MSDYQPNGERRFFMTLVKQNNLFARRTALICAVTVSACVLAGCVSSPFNAPVPADSTVSPRLVAIEHANLPYPRWSQFPAPPANLTTPATFAAEAEGVEASQRELLQQAAGLQWTLCCTEAWAAETRAAVAPAFATPAPPDSQAATAEFIRQMQAVSVPPPKPR